jgi:hypothetical protein
VELAAGLVSVIVNVAVLPASKGLPETDLLVFTVGSITVTFAAEAEALPPVHDRAAELF